MKAEVPISRVLGWRLAQAEADAPPAPRAVRLLEMVRPWWETWPEQFRSLVERLGQIQLAYGHAMAEPGATRGGFPVPAIVVLGGRETNTSLRVLYLDIRDCRMKFRFQLDAVALQAPELFEATFVADQSPQPLLLAPATLSVDTEYHVDAEVSAELARDWQKLRVTDRMPFRLLLRSGKQAG